MKLSKHSVLFICLGNICRSPAAEGIMKAKVKERGMAGQFFIDSAAIGSWHVGQLPDIRMRRCGAAHGYCFDSHARQFAKSDFAKFDYIIVMDNDNYHAIKSMASSDEERKKVVCIANYLHRHCDYTAVPDPYYGDEPDFELVITLLEDAIEGLIEEVVKR